MGREFASAASRWCHLLDLPFRPEIVAVADPVAAACEWFTRNVSTVKGAYSDYRELLTDPAVEAVYCAVPHNLHREVYVDVLAAGKHLMAEKPFGIDLEAAAEIYSAVEMHSELLVRCSSEFPFFPSAQRIVRMVESGFFGEIFEVRSGFLHSSDLDPNKPINWKRKIEFNGEYGCMGDLGLHACHLPLRFGWDPASVDASLSKVVRERPNGKGGMENCETWDNAVLACRTVQGFPMFLETKRIAPGETNTWYIGIYGTQGSAEFSTKQPKTLRTMRFEPGQPQRWQIEDTGYDSCYKAITGAIFEFGFSDSILQMWAAFCDELANGDKMVGPFRCATPEEALKSHRIFTEALKNAR